MQPLIVPGKLEFLDEIRKYMMQAAKEAGLEKARAYKLSLAVDEIATNIINYGYQASGLKGSITAEAIIDEHALTVTLDDTSGHFDPTLRPPPAPEAFDKPLEDRQIGGWGVYLAIQNVDEFYYHRFQDHNLNIFIMYKATHGELLMIDPSINSCKPVSEYLISLGYVVTCTESWQNALVLMKQHKYELVLVDLQVKDTSAEDFIKAMKADNALRSTPIIIVANQGQIEEAEKCIEAGAEDYILLPFRPVVLEARVRSILERQRVRMVEHSIKNTLNMNRELQIGRLIQLSFLPEKLPQFPGWEIAAKFEPAGEITGDFYDTFLLSDNHLGLVMGDVNGSGITSVLFMAIFRSLLRAYIQQAYSNHGDDQYDTKNGPVVQLVSAPVNISALKNAIQLTNKYIIANHNTKKIAAMIFFGIIDIVSGMLFYINAGYQPALIFSQGEVRETLLAGDSVVGNDPDADFEIQQTRLDPGDTLLIYSNGVSEAKSPGEGLFGMERIIRIVNQVTLLPEALLNNIATDLHTHMAGTVQSNDVMMLAIEHLN